MIKFNTIKAATIAATNENDADRVYNISADVETNNGKAVNVQSGMVTRLGEEMPENDENVLATFSGWNEKHLNVSLKNAADEEQETVFSAVRIFVKELRDKGGKLTEEGKLDTSLFA